jgi:hypothetical protein
MSRNQIKSHVDHICNKNFDVNKFNTREILPPKACKSLKIDSETKDVDDIPFYPMQILVPWFWVLLFS